MQIISKTILFILISLLLFSTQAFSAGDGVIIKKAWEGDTLDVVCENCDIETIDNAIQTIKNKLGKQTRGRIFLPSCDVSLNNKAFRIPAGISIIGNGRHVNRDSKGNLIKRPNPTIIRNAIFHFNRDHYGKVGNGLSRLSSMSIVNSMTTKNPYFTFRACVGFRIDNMYFEGRYSTFANIIRNEYTIVENSIFDLFTSYGFYAFRDNSFTEIDETHFDSSCNKPQYNYEYKNADAIFGKATPGIVIVENCSFTGRYDHLMDGRSGAHYIFRYNDIVYDSGSGPLEGHGPTIPADTVNEDDPPNPGTNRIEIYNVNITQNGTSGSAGILIRSGSAVVYNTKIKNKGYGIAIGIENSPYTYKRQLDDTCNCYVVKKPHGVWLWNITLESISQAFVSPIWNSDECLKWGNSNVDELNGDYFHVDLGGKTKGSIYIGGKKPSFYTPYIFPNPLSSSNMKASISIPNNFRILPN